MIALARLALLAGLASSQITLAGRAGVPDFTIMAALPWLAGATLLIEQDEQSNVPALAAIPASRWWAGVLAVLWCLLVLSFAGRLYDPLFWLVPLVALIGLALLVGLSWGAPVLRQLAVLGLLLPAQGMVNLLLPVEPLALATARISAQLLWLVGQPAFAEGNQIVMSAQVLLVDGTCTGRSTLSFCLASLVTLLILLPLPRRGRWIGVVALIMVTTIGVFLINGIRIALLAFTVEDPGPGLLAALRGFAFWHGGVGAQLFSLLAGSLVCGAYLLLLEWHLRRRRSNVP
ncbi:exosortase/archaeosortase family protein [Synechococcus sp. CS-1328]|uniref:exosortase/archaeosortase family protein n=1 Tax=Synechococcus sp. CS-1328 TaxID=2847976 RepID=UPI00223A757B|nr:exosortase/archaeosortase family protein [Synechococcus sp. CS-1328]MCT0225934.1 exosortase/archaeosortase family protein [Synechococcus sp. CS-1328]